MSPAQRFRSGGARGAALLLAAVILVSGLAWQLGRITLRAWAELRAPGPALADQAFGLLAGAVGTGVTLWLLSALTVSAVAALSARSRLAAPTVGAARAIAPATVRNAVAALLGVVLVATPAVAQAAASPPIGGVSSSAVSSAQPVATAGNSAQRRGPEVGVSAGARVEVGAGASDQPDPRDKLLQTLSPGWTPSRPRPSGATSTRRRPAHLDVVSPAPRRPQATHDGIGHHVVVRLGDTLWSIASRHLGPGATDAEIAREWPRWYRVNRHLIGADPHLLLPGERLRSPDAITSPAAQPEETGR